MAAGVPSIKKIRTENAHQPVVSGLPVKRDLTLIYIFSLFVALLVASASVPGLLYPERVYPSDELLGSFVPSDVFNLVVGLPMLLGSMWLAYRGKLVGLLSWPGALFYMLYMYIPYLIAVPINVLFLSYLFTVTLSVYTLIAILTTIDAEIVRRKLVGFVPARANAGILVGLAALIVVRQSARIISTLTGRMPVDPLEIPAWIADFIVVVPMLLIVGIQLWRRQALGYAAGAGLLLGYGVLALSVIPFFVFQARSMGSSIDTAGVVTVLTMAALCLIPFAFFVRGAAVHTRSPDEVGI